MPETEHFINEGYGWTCKRCQETEEAGAPKPNELARFFREGESEEKEPLLSSQALARWRDTASGKVLFCPLCGAEENTTN